MRSFPEIYISYIRGRRPKNQLSTQQVASSIQKHFDKKKYSIVIDEISVEFGGKLNIYLENFEKGQFVLLLISKDYLLFPASLFELALLNDYNIKKNVIPIILDEVQQIKSISTIDFEYYWGQKIFFLKESLQNIENSHYINYIQKELDLYQKSALLFANFNLYSTSLFINPANMDERINYLERIISGIFQIEYAEHLNEFKTNYLNQNYINYSVKIYGRESDLSLIHRTLKKEQILTIVDPISGSGKTTLAKAYISDKKYTKSYNNIAWIDIIGDLRTDLINQLSHSVNYSYKKEASSKQNFSNIIDQLHNLKGNNLLIIDKKISDYEITKSKTQLEKLDWKILILSRTEFTNIKHFSLSSLSNTDCYKILENYNFKINNKQIAQSFFEFINYNPILLNYVGKIIKFHDDITFSQIYAITENVSNKPPQELIKVKHRNYPHYSDVLIEQRILNIILNLNTLITYSDQEKEIIINFAALTPIEYSIKQLVNLFEIPNKKQLTFESILNNLADKSGLEKTKKHYYLHPIFQQVTSIQFNIKPKNCSQLFRSFTKKLQSPNIPINEKKLSEPHIKRFIYNFKNHNSLQVARLSKDLSEFYLKTDNLNKALNLKKLSIGIFKNLLPENHSNLAIYYTEISIIYEKLRHKSNELLYVKKAFDIQNNILPKKSKELAQSINDLAICYRKNKEYNKSEEHHKQCLMIYKGIENLDINILAAAHFELSITQYFSKNYTNANININIAVDLLNNSKDKNQIDLVNALEIQEIIHKKYNNTKK